MTKRSQIEIATLTFIIIAGFLTSYFAWKGFQTRQQLSSLAATFVSDNTTPSFTVSKITPIAKIDTASQISPDGTKKFVMESTHNANGTVTYIFTTTDASGNNQYRIYTTTVLGSDTLSIPFNTWSPDNKYVFIQKNNHEGYLFKANGESMTTQEPYFDVATLFTSKIKNNVYDRTTGWASPTLLIVNTLTPDNTKGPSYWFEVPSKAIIQLSSPF